MRPHEPVEPNEEIPSGFEDYPPKPEKLGTAMVQMDQFLPYDSSMHTVMQMDQPTPYGTMAEENDENVPLLKAQKVPLRRVQSVRMAEKSLFLLWWPAFLGTCVMTAFALGYWRHWVFCDQVLLLSLTLGGAMMFFGLKGGWPGKMSMTFMTVNGCCIMVMGLVGMLLGLVCFHQYTKSYEIYRASPVYENVAPRVNPGAHRDAGIIGFAAGSYVDSDHSIGIRNGDLYCVAPIMHADSKSYSGFWAAGLNCCKVRGNFQCGDISNSQVRGGLVVLDEDSFGAEEIPEYTKAAEQASLQFSIGMPAQPIFVKWSSDVNLDKDQYYHSSLQFLVAASGGLFGFMLVVTMMFACLADGTDTYAQHYYNVEVDDLGDAEPVRRARKGKKAKDPLSRDPFHDL